MTHRNLKNWLRHLGRLGHSLRRPFLQAFLHLARLCRRPFASSGARADADAPDRRIGAHGYAFHLLGPVPGDSDLESAAPCAFPLAAYAEATAPLRSQELEWVQAVRVDSQPALDLWRAYAPEDAEPPQETAPLMVIHAAPDTS